MFHEVADTVSDRKARVKQFSSKCTEQITNLATCCGKISRSVGWTCMQRQSCRFVSVVAAALKNTTTSYHIELKDLRTLLRHKLAQTVQEISHVSSLT